MSIFDCMTIDLPGFPGAPGVELQVYPDIADSYGDFYHVDTAGQLWRLTDQACMSRSPTLRMPSPGRLNYNDPAMEAYGPDTEAYLAAAFIADTSLVAIIAFCSGMLTMFLMLVREFRALMRRRK